MLNRNSLFVQHDQFFTFFASFFVLRVHTFRIVMRILCISIRLALKWCEQFVIKHGLEFCKLTAIRRQLMLLIVFFLFNREHFRFHLCL